MIPTMIPEEATIRALDGDALARLAILLGLAPDGTKYMEVAHGYYTDTTTPTRQWVRWEPHTDIAQADAVLRKLRQYGWMLRVFSIAHWGRVEAEDDGHVKHLAEWDTDNQREDTSEAMALLRCACLARAAQLRGVALDDFDKAPPSTLTEDDCGLTPQGAQACGGVGRLTKPA